MKEVTLSAQDSQAITLAITAILLWVIVFGWNVLLSYCENTTDANDKLKLIRIGSAKVIIQFILIIHTVNAAVFMFLKSGWQQLANWINLLLPEKGNTLIMVFTYFAFFAILKITQRDVGQLVSFVLKKFLGDKSETHP